MEQLIVRWRVTFVTKVNDEYSVKSRYFRTKEEAQRYVDKSYEIDPESYFLGEITCAEEPTRVLLSAPESGKL